MQEFATDDLRILTVPERTMRNYCEAFHYVQFLYNSCIFNIPGKCKQTVEYVLTHLINYLFN